MEPASHEGARQAGIQLVAIVFDLFKAMGGIVKRKIDEQQKIAAAIIRSGETVLLKQRKQG